MPSFNLDQLTLDARPDRLDLRDRIYQPPLVGLAPRVPTTTEITDFLPRYIADGRILDQASEGACTGFGLGCVVNYLLWRNAVVVGGAKTSPPVVSTRMLYHLARFYDEWSGEDYEGSSCRGAMKAWHKHGVCSDKHWPYRTKRGHARFIKPRKGWESDAATRPLGAYYRIDKSSIDDIRAAIQETGAVYCSARVHDGWSIGASATRRVTHEKLPVIAWDGGQRLRGGHAFAFVGYNEWGFIVQNSWGERWGLSGFAVLTYRDWVKNGSDAWVASMGAATYGDRAPQYFVVSGVDGPAGVAKDQFSPVTILNLLPTRERPHVYQNDIVRPWDRETAYQHSVVMGNDGRVINRLVDQEDAGDAVRTVAFSSPGAWLRAATHQHVVIYAHGGLNSEGDSLHRIQILAPYFKANGIYPIFLTWRTGLIESLLGIMQDAVRRTLPSEVSISDFLREASERAAAALDYTLEAACERLGAKTIWSQMKQNAEAAGDDTVSTAGLVLLAEQLADLRQARPDFKLHLIGHSAGSILLGHLLDLLRKNGVKADSCSLFAAACSVDFANRHYIPAVRSGVLKKQDLHLHYLSDAREKADTVGPYRKSLLYLVSRALERWHKTPLLGMERAVRPPHNRDLIWNADTQAHIDRWGAFWRGPRNEYVVDTETVVTAAQWDASGNIVTPLKTTEAAHGSFDNDVEVIDAAIRRITDTTVAPYPAEYLSY
jgi:hypothetical protein